MPGKEARDGFWFQDAKALTRLLDDALERRRRRLLGIDLGSELRVRVESAVELTVDGEPEGAEPVAPRPTWDGTFVTADTVVVDECKLGGAKIDDRVTFYRRLRATIASGVPIERLTPCLTAGRDKISDAERWEQLPERSQVVAPAHERARVDTADKLAAEALYYLTAVEPVWKRKKQAWTSQEPASDYDDDDVPATPALSLDEARTLLSRFELDATTSIEEVEERLRGQLESVGAELVVDQLVLLLRGWIDEAARAREWRGDLTADSLVEQLRFVARYMQVPPHIEALWHRLRHARPVLLPPPVISAQPWREVQPKVDEIVRDQRNTRIVLTSEGGVGKSFLLAALYGERNGGRVWIDAVAPANELEQALALGASALQRNGEELAVFIDGIDQMADPAGLLAVVDRALTSYGRAVTNPPAKTCRGVPKRPRSRQ